MKDATAQAAAIANKAMYDALAREKYIEGAPHIKHRELRELFGRLLHEALKNVAERCDSPRVLDLGAGEGSVTLLALAAGAEVHALDISPPRLALLREKCSEFSERLTTLCADVNALDAYTCGPYDLIVASAFLHHVPDYKEVLKKAGSLLTDDGQILIFQELLRYDTLACWERAFTQLAYYSWRVSQGDLISGLGRWIRRRLGYYRLASVEDNSDYHLVRGGMDQAALRERLENFGLKVREVRYFSTQNGWFQRLGQRLGVENTFALVATGKAEKRICDALPHAPFSC